jgi:hypothetical protein
LSRLFVAFLVFAAVVFAGFVVLARRSTEGADVLPPQHARGPSHPNTDPPRITPRTQGGITVTASSIGFGPDTDVRLVINNDSAYPLALTDPFVTAVWNGREYTPIGWPRDPNTNAVVPRTIPPRAFAAVQAQFPWTETARYVLILVRGTSRGRTLEWESGLPGVNRRLDDRLGG